MNSNKLQAELNDLRTVWCGNLAEEVTEKLLYELFLQVAPLDRVRIPTDKEGRKSNFAFVTMRHEISVEYAIELLNGTKLFDRRLNIKPRVPMGSRQYQPPPMPLIPFENNYPQHVFDDISHPNMMANMQNVFEMRALLGQSYNQSHNQQYNNSNNHRKRSPYERNDNHSGRNNSGSYNRHDNYDNFGDNSRRRHRNQSYDRSNRNRFY